MDEENTAPLTGCKDVDKTITLYLSKINDISNLYYTSKSFQSAFENYGVLDYFLKRTFTECDPNIKLLKDFICIKKICDFVSSRGVIFAATKALETGNRESFIFILESFRWKSQDFKIYHKLCIDIHSMSNMETRWYESGKVQLFLMSERFDHAQTKLKEYFAAIDNLAGFKLLQLGKKSDFLSVSVLTRALQFDSVKIFDYLINIYPFVNKGNYLVQLLKEHRYPRQIMIFLKTHNHSNEHIDNLLIKFSQKCTAEILIVSDSNSDSDSDLDSSSNSDSDSNSDPDSSSDSDSDSNSDSSSNSHSD
jgi:hypothetical protein